MLKFLHLHRKICCFMARTHCKIFAPILSSGSIFLLADWNPRFEARSGFDRRIFGRFVWKALRVDAAPIKALADAFPTVSEYLAGLIFGAVADWTSYSMNGVAAAFREHPYSSQWELSAHNIVVCLSVRLSVVCIVDDHSDEKIIIQLMFHR